jgi:acetamidase/formamidase
MGTHHSLEPHTYWYTFGPNAPALRARSGDTVTAPTRDARGMDADLAPLPPEAAQRSADTIYWPSNPLVGPIYVEDTEPGDTLAVHIRDIRLTRPTAWSRHLPHFGSFTGEGQGKMLLLNAPLEEQYYEWALDRESMVGRLPLPRSRIGAVEIPLHPFLGSIGVAPAYGRVETALTPGEFGGNMDCVDTAIGATLFLPVWVRGAYLAFGDAHAAQGDGEICGVALETSAEVTLDLEVRKGWTITWPRIENATHIMTAGSARPLMDCVRLAHVEMIEWLIADHGYDRWEAFQVLSQAGTMRVGNVVDPNYTVVCKFPKRYLP